MKKKTNRKINTRLKTLRDLILLFISVSLIYIVLAPEADHASNLVSISDLKGVWTTVHPEYQDRVLQFSDDVVTFGRGDKGVGSYALDAIVSQLAKQGTLVDVRYHDVEAVDYHLRFYYVHQNGGALWMKNQNGVYWRRTDTEPLYESNFK